MRSMLVAGLAVFALVFAGCEKPDASYVTSPGLKALIGTTTGNTAFNPPETPPAPQAPPDHWQVDFGLARWTTLENDSPSIEIVMQVATRPGAGMELWVREGDKTIARWSGGSTAVYVGTVCFQLELAIDGEAVPIGTGPHTATLVFRDPGSGVIAARTLPITNTTPKLEGGVPGAASEVFREGLACRRGQ